ncbi:hypothetical protein [Gilliamella intestini]|uniref:hypothetical protein n=1 Tax=Gilliamella intestini TaxID=1798183 RepID=UPI000B84F9B3|nr:hypothetical protein [Gilliamella intestini]
MGLFPVPIFSVLLVLEKGYSILQVCQVMDIIKMVLSHWLNQVISGAFLTKKQIKFKLLHIRYSGLA